MKIKRLLKSESPIISTTLFFIGIVLSAGSLYEFQNNRDQITIFQVSLTVGLTFLAGLMAIYVVARSVRETVVYLAQKKEEDRKQQTDAHSIENQLSDDTLQEIIDDGHDVSSRVINEVSRQLECGQTALYVTNGTHFELRNGFALSNEKTQQYSFAPGEGLVGRVAAERKSLYIDQLPKGYITIFSGLGAASPTYLAIVPLKDDEDVKGVLELATFKPLTGTTLLQLENIGKAWAKAGL